MFIFVPKNNNVPPIKNLKPEGGFTTVVAKEMQSKGTINYITFARHDFYCYVSDLQKCSDLNKSAPLQFKTLPDQVKI